MIAVRGAAEADVAFLTAAQAVPHARGFVLPATEAEVRAALTQPDRATFVVTDEGAPVGMFLLATFPDPPWLVELRRIVVTRPGRGIGTFALQWALTFAFEHVRAHRIWLEVVESNGPARRLYERGGFVHEGTHRDGFRDEDGSFHDLCLYGRLVTDPHGVQ